MPLPTPEWMEKKAEEVEKTSIKEAWSGPSEKESKEMGKMFKSLKDAAKGGAVTMITDLMMKFGEVAGIIGPFTDFFDMFMGFLTAENADILQRVQDALFSDTMIELAGKLATIIGELLEVGLAPALLILERLLPLLVIILPLISSLADGLVQVTNAGDLMWKMLFGE